MNIITHNTSGNKNNVTFDSFTFAGGEEHIRFNPSDFADVTTVIIEARLISSMALIQLMMANDALRRIVGKLVNIELAIPYFPYARQDRVCVEGEALGAAVIAGFINGLGFSKVTISDAHSDVSPALINNVVNVPQIDILKKCDGLCKRLSAGELTLVSPDAGASKKTLKIAEAFNGIPQVIAAQKVRNLQTGEIIKTEINQDVTGKKVLIADDICDGGRTFIELAKILRERGAVEVSLFVTHGIFSKGLSVFDGLIDTIYTTDSCRPLDALQSSERTQVKIIAI